MAEPDVSPNVSIIIPTFLRPGRALAAARSALSQSYAGEIELILVDNDPAGAALTDLRRFASDVGPHVIVLHEPRAGVSNARNAALARARGRFIAFLDDDQVADRDWLASLIRVADAHTADVVFAPTRTRLIATPREHTDFFHAFFARDPGHVDGAIDVFYGAGNSLIRRDALPSAEPFSDARNEIGGEDDLLFQQMKAAGARFAWSSLAIVWETPDQKRVTLGYTLKRAFAYGQGPATHCWFAAPRDVKGAGFWMMVGVGQVLAHAPLALLAWGVRAPRRAFVYRRLVEAVGKVAWMPVIKPKFYGASQLPRAATAQQPTQLVPATQES